MWPHESVYIPEGQPTAYESLSIIMVFVTGFITIMDLQPEALRRRMSAHLKEIMGDGETFGWPVVRAYLVVWLQHLQLGRAMWDDEATRLKLRRALVWHKMAPSSQPSATPATTAPKAPDAWILPTQGAGRVLPTTRVCAPASYAHPANLHMCSFCLQTAHRLC